MQIGTTHPRGLTIMLIIIQHYDKVSMDNYWPLSLADLNIELCPRNLHKNEKKAWPSWLSSPSFRYLLSYVPTACTETCKCVLSTGYLVSPLLLLSTVTTCFKAISSPRLRQSPDWATMDTRSFYLTILFFYLTSCWHGIWVADE